MRLVLDTNVLVRAFLAPAPGNESEELLMIALEGTKRSRIVVLYDQRIAREWRRVLVELELLTVRDAGRLVRRLQAVGEKVPVSAAVEALRLRCPDPADRPFMEVAIAGEADALVTFNDRDFPRGQGYERARPVEVLRALGRRPRENPRRRRRRSSARPAYVPW